MKWLQALLQRNKNEESTREEVAFGSSFDASKNGHNYELTDPLHREPPWSIPIPLAYSSVQEALEQEFRTVIVPNYRVIFSVSSEDPALAQDRIVSRYTIRLKEQDSFGNKLNPSNDIVCIIALRYIEPNITAIDCEVPNSRNRPYYNSIYRYMKVIIEVLYRRDDTVNPTAQEIVLHDPHEIIESWGMSIPLNMSKFHFEDLKLEDLGIKDINLEDIDPDDLKQDPKSTLMRELKDQLRKDFSYYHVALLSSINEDAFATYTIREPRDNAFVCSLTLTLTDSMLTVAVDLPPAARRERYEYICDRARDILLLIYRVYGDRKQEQSVHAHEPPTIPGELPVSEGNATTRPGPSPSQNKRRPRAGTKEKIFKIAEERARHIAERGSAPSRSRTIRSLNSDESIVKTYAPTLYERWDEVMYTWNEGDWNANDLLEEDNI